jgi:hypothetical protein
MLDYYFTHKDKKIYKMTDYLCNEKDEMCICNIHAENFRKIYNTPNYIEGNKYISWCKKIKEHF